MSPELEDEKRSPEWDRIKNFVGGRNKPAKHPLVQEMERAKMRQPEHFDEGGTAGDMPQLMGDLTPGSSDQIPVDVPRGTNTPIPTPPALVNKQAPAPMPTAPAAPAPVGLSTGPAPSPIDTSDAQATKIMGGVTPETIQRLLQNLNSQSKGAQVGAGIAGIGDAIASVGGQNPGHMKNAEDLIQKRREEALAVPGQMSALGKEKFGITEQLQAKDPNSAFSKVTQNAERPTLKKLGWSDDQISKTPAIAIQDATKNSLTYEDTQAKFGLEKATIAQTGAYQQGMLANTKAEIGQKGEEARVAAAQDVVKNYSALNPLNKVSKEDYEAALQTIKNAGKGGQPNFDHASIPKGTRYTAPDGTTRIKQ